MHKCKQESAPSVAGRMVAPYRFHDEDGQVREWLAGQPVSPDEMTLLRERGAPVEVA